ncbi:MAG: leucine-rich repeat domain-containing protein [Chitinispirillales bacterium]|jgi:hypothetical protein|nr:leucine-rich repeat domain-containing protein [Chitinispirillales bacterium]
MTAKNYMKSVIIATAITIICFADPAQAQGPWNIGVDGSASVTATLSEGTLTISGEGGMMSGAAFPWENIRETITSVVIEDGVTAIGGHAFRDFVSLTSVTLPNSLILIMANAFQNCSSLTSVTIPNSVRNIFNHVFSGCANLASVTIGDNVIFIGASAFENTALTSVTIPDSVQIISGGVFEGCNALTAINVGSGNPEYASVDGVLFYKNMSALIHYPANRPATSYNIPADVTSIYGNAFLNCSNLTSVTIPSGATEIGGYAFAGCAALTTVDIPNSVTEIGASAFAGSGLTSVTIPAGVTSIASGVFQDAVDLASVTIGANVVDIGWNAFTGTASLTSITIPNSVVSIGSEAFAGSGLTSIAIPNSVTDIEPAAFAGNTALASITIGASVEHIGWNAFAGCYSLASIDVDNDNTRYRSVDGVLFRDGDDSGGEFTLGEFTLIHYPASKTNTSYAVPDDVVLVEFGAFDGVANLATLTIPNSVIRIEGPRPGQPGSPGSYNTLNTAGSLTSIIALSPIPCSIFWSDSDDYNAADFFSNVCAYVPEGSVAAYRDSEWGSLFECIRPISEYVSIAVSNREIPQSGNSEEASVIAPVVISSGELIAGPNPISKLSGKMNFYWNGRRINNTALTIFDASGNVVNRVTISDVGAGFKPALTTATSTESHRIVGTWDLTDIRGRLVSEGTYLVRGMITTLDGNRERVSVIVGVR